jgi:hypothetical protein
MCRKRHHPVGDADQVQRMARPQTARFDDFHQLIGARASKLSESLSPQPPKRTGEQGQCQGNAAELPHYIHFNSSCGAGLPAAAGLLPGVKPAF